MDSALPIGRLALLLFMLMGPIGLIPAFDRATAGRDPRERRLVAIEVAVFAILALALAVFLGTAAMARVGTSPPSLIVAAGLILAITALRNILAAGSPGAGAPPTGAASDAMPRWMPALSPLAIPGLVSPVVVAILVIFTTSFPAPEQRFMILGVALGIMVLNVLAMFVAGAFMRRVGMAPLLLLGAVFGVLQVALGIEILADGLALAIAQRIGG